MNQKYYVLGEREREKEVDVHALREVGACTISSIFWSDLQLFFLGEF